MKNGHYDEERILDKIQAIRHARNDGEIPLKAALGQMARVIGYSSTNKLERKRCELPPHVFKPAGIASSYDTPAAVKCDNIWNAFVKHAGKAVTAKATYEEIGTILDNAPHSARRIPSHLAAHPRFAFAHT